MEIAYKPLYRRNRLAIAMTGEIQAMSDNDLKQNAKILREEADKLISGMIISNDSNQDLYDELELRHGGGSAQ